MAGMEANLLDQAMEEMSSLFKQTNKTDQEPPAPTGPTTEDPFFQDTFFHPSLIQDSEPCKAILHYHVGSSNLRVWDLILLLPNLAFLLFLFYRLPSTRLKLRATSSSLQRSLYSLVLTCSLASALRCLLSMLLHLDSREHDLADKAVWVSTRFVLLAAELSVVACGGAFGVRDTKENVRRIGLVCGGVAGVVCGVQAYLEIFQPFYGFQVN